MKRFFAKIGRFFWSWGFLKFVLGAIALIIFLYVEEDWRGARAWAATKAKWEARGETFDPNAYYPRPVPDDENLATLPIFKQEPDPKYSRMLAPLKLQQALDEDSHGGDLPRINESPDEIRAGLAAAYARAFPGTTPPADPLKQFEALYPIIPEIRAAAATRSYFRLNEDYSAQPPMLRSIGLLTSQIKLSQRLNLHAIIALEDNQSQVAMDDIKINFQLATGVGRDPTLVGGLVAAGITAITRGTVDKGIALHAWNDAQLVELENELAKIDFLSQYQFTLRSEIITETIPNFDYIKATVVKTSATVAMYGLFPGGWFDQDKSRMIDFLFRELKCIDPQSRRVFPEVNRQMEHEMEKEEALPWRLAPWNIFFAVSAPTFTGLSQRFAEIQAWLDEDQIACALERYHLAHGVYPESLDALVPACIDTLPHDIMNGEPYHYQLKPDGTFLLYSVGWNQKDDGGTVVDKKDAPSQVDPTEGDWPWPTPKVSH